MRDEVKFAIISAVDPEALTRWADAAETETPSGRGAVLAQLDLADGLLEHGAPAAAVVLLESAGVIAERGLGRLDVIAIDGRVRLARARRAAGRTDEATTLEIENLRDTIAALGPQHPLAARARIARATTLQDLGDLDAAIALLEEAVQQSVELLGAASWLTIARRHRLAATYREAGRSTQALAEAARAYRDACDAHGKRDPMTIATGATLVRHLEAAGRPRKAERLQRKLVRRAETAPVA